MASEDEELEELQEEAKALGIDLDSLDSETSYGSPKSEKKEGIFKFFKWVLQFSESWKVGNLNNTEIGQSKLSIRSYLELAKYSEVEGLDNVSKYFIDRANIVAGTSMGRKGFIAQLFVTQIKKEQKIKEPAPEKKRWFGKSTTEGENE